MSAHVKKFAVAEDSLKCKTGCGYYGSYAFQGFCSKCYREFYQKSHASAVTSFTDNDRPSLNEHEKSATLHSSATKFGRFNEKKKFQTEKRNKVKTLLSKQVKDNPHAKVLRQLSDETVSVTEDFVKFLKTLSKPTSDDINKEMSNFLKRIDKIAYCVPIEELAHMVQDFYQCIGERFRNQGLIKDCDAELPDQLLDNIEKRIMTEMYKTVFPIVASNFEDKDIALQKRIRSLNWVTASHLDCGLDESLLSISEQVLEAITAILEMDSKRAPQDKLLCVVNCSILICNILQQAQDRPASADEFLPALIYVIIKGNPPRLHSNIDYISRFCNPSKLLSGEAGYYFTNLCCAVTFISDLNAESLNLTQDEFESYMSGEALPPGSWSQSFRMCEGLRLMEQNMITLKEYKGREALVQEQISSLLDNLTRFHQSITSQITDAKVKYPLLIKPRKNLSDLLNEEVTVGTLPSPIQPEVLSGVLEDDKYSLGDEKLQSIENAESPILFKDNPEMNDVHLEQICFPELVDKKPYREDNLNPVMPLNPTIYSGFTAQGEKILSIPCETAKENTISLPFVSDKTESLSSQIDQHENCSNY